MDPNCSGVIRCSSTKYEMLSRSSAKLNLIVSCWASLICIFFIMAINSNFIWSVKFSKGSKRVTNDLYIMLSLCDLITGIVSLPIYAFILTGYHKGIPNCTMLRIRLITGYVCATLAITTIGFITAALCVAVMKPFLYKTKPVNKVLVYLLIIFWVLWIFSPLFFYYIFPSLYGIYKVVTTVWGVLVFILMLFCHLTVQRYLRVCPSKHAARNKKPAKIALQILLVYIFCYLPGGLKNIYVLIYSNSAFQQSYIDPWIYFIILTNAVFDTFVYGSRTGRVESRTTVVFRSTTKTAFDRQ